MKATYATMVGNICLDKNEPDFFGRTSPITFHVQKILNGHLPWQGQIYRHDSDTLEQAMKELHAVFLLEMSERNYEFRIEGESIGYLDNEGTPEYFKGETGWYDLDNPSEDTDYPANDYPSELSEWIDHKITSYAYDNYHVCIVTSNFDLVP
jgi:hypothetical protein